MILTFDAEEGERALGGELKIGEGAQKWVLTKPKRSALIKAY